MNLNSKYISLLIALLISVLSGFVFEYLYHHGQFKPFFQDSFTGILHQKISQSDQIVDQISKLNHMDDANHIHDLLALKKDLGIYIFNDDALIFWNTNQFQIDARDFQKDNQWHFTALSNVDGIYKWQFADEKIGILTLIPIKSNFPYENNYLRNNFHQRFSLDKNIQLTAEETADGVEITDLNGNFLFSLQTEKSKHLNETYRLMGFISFGVAFLFLMMIYFNINLVLNTIKLKPIQFWTATILFGIGILILCYLDYPTLFFSNQLFSPYHYAANVLINTITHLTVICIFLIVAIMAYYLKVKKQTGGSMINRIGLYLYVLLYFEILKSLILHSNINFNITVLRDINFFNLWAQLLIFGLCIGLFILFQILNNGNDKKITYKNIIRFDLLLVVLTLLAYRILFEKFILLFAILLISILAFDYIRKYFFGNQFTFVYFGIFLLIMSTTTLISSYQLNEYKKDIKYKIQSENILVNGNSENDPIAELLLEELDEKIRSDAKLRVLLENPDSAEIISQYVFNTHLRGFWNKYDVQIFPVSRHSSEFQHYTQFLKFTGKKLKETSFYSLPASLYDLSFVGLIDLSNEPESDQHDILILEFQPKRHFRSYSFPDLLISNESYVLNQSNISIAKYENSKLIYSDSKFEWSENDLLFHEINDGFQKIKFHDQYFYVFSKSNLRIVITEILPSSLTTLFFYYLFTFLVSLLIGRIFFWVFEVKTQKKNYTLGLTSKFQLVFITLLFMSFLGILIFSVNYIKTNYEQEQISTLENKKQYLQKSLQDLYYWTEDISSVDELSLNSNLQELAYRYQTDINIYNNAGKLMGSSQSLIFSKNLLSNFMSPEALFTEHAPENQYEQIGNLNYLAAYTDLINGDYLQIGYISIPQYLSQTEINAKIELFLIAIIQIYLIIIVLSIIFILIAGKQLAEPLNQLEIKLKSMHLGGKNEKIDYKWKDEIGQLVEQYNRTVDELEKSTQLLLESERETAWRTMAKQVAHEINNPLTPMKLTIQQLQRTKQMDVSGFDVYFDKAAKTLIEQIDNLARIAGTFSQFARMPETKFTKVDVAAKLYSVVELFKHNHENIEITYSGEKNQVTVLGDADQLIQVFNNILKNATQAIKKGAKGKIWVELHTIDYDVILIKFTDNGSGIPTAIQPDIFKPNFTTKTTGMGLGLSISKNLIDNMGGKISFLTKEDESTTFEIMLNKQQ
ncbi:MAG: ATP-binding protein [Paludibacter sp.]|nr:ATP-binding protein [Paludibacter sp.]